MLVTVAIHMLQGPNSYDPALAHCRRARGGLHACVIRTLGSTDRRGRTLVFVGAKWCGEEHAGPYPLGPNCAARGAGDARGRVQKRLPRAANVVRRILSYELSGCDSDGDRTRQFFPA